MPLNQFLKALGSAASSVVSGVTSIFHSGAEKIKSVFSSAIGAIQNLVQSLVDSISSMFDITVLYSNTTTPEEREILNNLKALNSKKGK